MGETREDNVARYLEEFHGVRPMEGGVVQAGFQQLAADIAQVRAQMQQLEAFAAAAGPAVAVQPSSQPPERAPPPSISPAWTAKVDEAIRKTNLLDEFYASHNVMCARVNEQGNKIDLVSTASYQAHSELA